MRDDKDGGNGLILPKWLKPVLSSAVLAVTGALFQMYTDLALVKQDVAGINRTNDKRDDRIDRLERGQSEFHSEAIGKLDTILERHRK